MYNPNSVIFEGVGNGTSSMLATRGTFDRNRLNEGPN